MQDSTTHPAANVPPLTDLGPEEIERLYRQRLNRLVTAMDNRTPDRVPIRPFLAEAAGKFAGYDCQQITQDFEQAFDAVRQFAARYDCDALVGNMVYVWSGLVHALGLRYYGVPGIGQPVDHGFQYLEPPEDQAWMQPEEYDHLIEDPTDYLYSVWLPRVSTDIQAPGDTLNYRNQLALVKGGMAMWHYFIGFAGQAERMRVETAMPGALQGILKAPMDILADKLRGYMGLMMDLHERRDKVIAACKALAPHLLQTALNSADPTRHLPIGFWLHRSCVPLIRPVDFDEIHWPTLKPIIENLWAAGHQTLFYAEGNWNAHLEAFCELPTSSIVYQVDRDDIEDVHKRIGHKFCVCGGVPNTMLSFGSPEQVRQQCRQVIEAVAGDGGFIMDAAAIVQNDAKEENIAAMIEATRQFGIYHEHPCDDPPKLPAPEEDFVPTDITAWDTARKPGVCVPWSQKVEELAPIEGHPDLIERVWNDVEGFGYNFIWHCLVSF